MIIKIGRWSDHNWQHNMSEKSPKLKRAKLDIEDISSNPDSSPVNTHESSLSEEAYYNENFKFIINYVLESVDGHVISAEEKMFVQRFLDLNSELLFCISSFYGLSDDATV